MSPRSWDPLPLRLEWEIIPTPAGPLGSWMSSIRVPWEHRILKSQAPFQMAWTRNSGGGAQWWVKQ